MSDTKNNPPDKVEIVVPFGALTLVSLALYQIYQASGAHGAWLILPLAYVALCLTACLAMLDTPSRLWIAGTLRKGRFTQIYVAATQRRLDWLWARYCNPVDTQAPPLAIFRVALSARLYDRALLLAVVYPLLLPVLAWMVTGQEVLFGATVLISGADLWPVRAMAVPALILLLGMVMVTGMQMFRRHSPVSDIAGGLKFTLLPVFLLVLSGLFLVELVGVDDAPLLFFMVLVSLLTVYGSGAVAAGISLFCAIGLAVYTAMAPESTPVFIGVFSAATLLPVFGFVVWLTRTERTFRPSGRALTLVTVAMLLIWIALILIADRSILTLEFTALFLFLAVFPVINALFDFLSYAVTLTLARLGLRSGQPWAFGLLDLAIALVLFAALGATLVLVVEGLGRFAGAPLLDHKALFAGIAANPQDYLWLYAMVFSTLIPTLAHATLSLLGFQALAPLRLRRSVANLLQDAAKTRWKAALAPLALAALWLAPFAVLGGLGWLGWLTLGEGMQWIAWRYLDGLALLSEGVAG